MAGYTTAKKKVLLQWYNGICTALRTVKNICLRWHCQDDQSIHLAMFFIIFSEKENILHNLLIVDIYMFFSDGKIIIHLLEYSEKSKSKSCKQILVSVYQQYKQSNRGSLNYNQTN